MTGNFPNDRQKSSQQGKGQINATLIYTLI